MKDESKYIATMAIANSLRKQGILTDEDYCRIDTIFREKYAPSLSTLFTDIRLLNIGNRANMHADKEA